MYALLPAPAPWYATPLATELHPVHTQPALAWQLAMADAMSGPRASPLFRDTATALDVRWRLVAVGAPVPEPTDALFEAARDLSLTGAALGARQVVDQTLDRSEVLSVAQDVVRGLVRPGLVVQRQDGHLHAHLDEGVRAPRAAIASAMELPRPGARPPPAPTLRIGGGLGLAEGTWSADGGWETQPLPAVHATLSASQVGVDVAQLEALWLAPWDRADEVRARWALVVREGLIYNTSLGLEAWSADERPVPARARLSLSWPLPARPGWLVRGGVARTWEDSTLRDGEWRVELALRANLGWHVPVDLRRWPLGQEIDGLGPVFPCVPDRGPNEVAPVVRDPAERVGEGRAGSGDG